MNIVVDGQYLELIEKMKYLGTLITEEIKTDLELETRSNLAKAKFSELSKIFTSKRLKLKTKLNILNSYNFFHFYVWLGSLDPFQGSRGQDRSH